MPPHVTIIGSSGAGPIAPATPISELQARLEPIASSTPPLTLKLGAPVRFMQTEIIVLPLNPHGPLRELHERIRRSGLTYARPRFAFTPHITLSFYRELDAAERRACVRSNITQLVDRLEADGLVKRSDDPRDRRSVRAELTAEGRSRYEAGLKALGSAERELFKPLGNPDRDKLLELLAALRSPR